MRVAIVAPCHIQPTKAWVDNLDREAKANIPGVEKVDVIIVDDSDGKVQLPADWRVYDYAKQQEFLGEDYEVFARLFHKSSACRNFGHLVAKREGYDVIIGLDSDCLVPFNFVLAHLGLLGKPAAYGWTNPIAGTGMYNRGYPYFARGWNISANMGLWENVLDLNGKDRTPTEPRRLNIMGNQVATGPMAFSGMNFSMLTPASAAYLFLPNFKSGEDDFRRIDDVWGGLIFYHLLRKKREAISFGQPIVFHDTVVVPAEDAKEEAAMYAHEEEFADEVETATAMFDGKDYTYEQLFESFARNFSTAAKDTFSPLYEAMNWWVKVNNK